MSETPTPPLGPLPLVEGPAPAEDPWIPRRKAPSAAVAARLLDAWESGSRRDTLFVAASERRADEIARALGAMASPDLKILVFPPWDCLPFDRASPSRESMGRRVGVLADLAAASDQPRLVVTSPEAVMQRTPPLSALSERFELEVGTAVDRVGLEQFALRSGYVHDERIDEPGEIALLGEVIDVYPPAATAPVRVVVGEDDIVTEIRSFDPVTQRSLGTVQALSLTAASELIIGDGVAETPPPAGAEHGLAQHYGGALGSLFDTLPEADLLLDANVAERVARVDAQILEAFETRRLLGETLSSPSSAADLYMQAAETLGLLSHGRPLDLDDLEPAPNFALERAFGPALRRYVEHQVAAGRRIRLAGLPHEHRVLTRLFKRNGLPEPTKVDAWSIRPQEAAAITAAVADLDGGFEDHRSGQVVLTPMDITGGRLARSPGASQDPFGDTEIRPGDVVIHEDHGLGVVQTLEHIEADGVRRDVLRLEYHGGASVLAPVEEFDRLWRYGSERTAVTLDRLNTQGWAKRRAEVSAQIDATAAQMVELAKVRAAAETPPITPPKAAYARFTARFPFPESVDQAAAIDAVLADLASGKPMNRLVCGDVGFGKTEVALRAAAAVALTGRQVLLAAPTTVLARQHYGTFRRRFEGTGVRVAQLSRGVGTSEAKAVRAGLADGSIQVVIGTHALAGRALTFADAALVVIDEEHRFGARLKADLAERAPHLLSLSATPIPRTLQSALVGIQDVSLIASPPARRRPIRTFLTEFDEASVRTVLLREHSRGGQSFVVAPRIEDLAPLADRLAHLVPELEVVQAHGKLPVDALDATMTGFAEGRGDVLLATNIIENGLDVPRANTMIVWRPDRFGLAQLHQLRGRVGRGRRQGFAYLLSEPDAPLAENTLTRLQTLEALDRLGAGFAISARDLDLRGGGDLVGEEQAGHIRLIGASLYQQILARALRAARGEGGAEPRRPTLNLPLGGGFPDDYVPDVVVRIGLYARLARVASAEEVDALAEEIEDRFGPLPEAAAALLSASRLTALAIAAGVTEVVSGPKATAFRFEQRRAKRLAATFAATDDRRWSDDRLLIAANDAARHDHAFLERTLAEFADAG